MVYINIFGTLIIVMGISISYRRGYLESLIKFPKWITHKYDQIKFYSNLLNNIHVENKQGLTSHIEILDTDISAKISYNYGPKKFHVFVPYRRDYVINMSQFKVELLNGDQIIQNITQSPGIPYLITASILGGDSIRIINEETSMSYIYDIDTCPMYGMEVFNNE